MNTPLIVLRPYTIYTNPIQKDTLRIVRFLARHGIDARPHRLINRNHPPWVSTLPVIQEPTGMHHVGLYDCVRFYERNTGIDNLLTVSKQCVLDHEDYTYINTQHFREHYHVW